MDIMEAKERLKLGTIKEIMEDSIFHKTSYGKGRSISTSTPVCHHSQSKTKAAFVQRSLSVSACSNDSGYAESLDSTVSSLFGSYCGRGETVTVPSSGTPIPSASRDAYLLGRHLDFSPSPVQNFHVRTSVSSSPCFSDWEEPEEEQVFEKLTTFHSDVPMDIPMYSLDFVDEDEAESALNIQPSLNTSGLAETFDRVLRHFSPAEPDRLIGMKMGLSFVDIMFELHTRNMSAAVTCVLSYLQPQDICKMCQVSQKWKELTECYQQGNRRRLKYLKLLRWERKKKYPVRHERGLTEGAGMLTTLQFIGDKTRETLPSACVKADLFAETAKTLKNDERLQHCPKCMGPSAVLPVQDRGKCQKDICSFDYCTKCFYEFHGARPCISIAAKRTKTDTLGSKKSKRNLKRL